MPDEMENIAATPNTPEKAAQLDAQAKRPRRRKADEPGISGDNADPNQAKPNRAGELDEQLLFGKYTTRGIQVTDRSIEDYIRFSSQNYPNIFGRRRNQHYYITHIGIVERLVNKLMRGGTGKKIGGKVIRTEGRLQGKKIKVMHILEEAFSIINKKTGKNPIQVLVDAVQNAAPIEDTTRVRYGGISYNVAVGISSNRRVDVALRNIAVAALIGAFRNNRKLSEALANELMLASNNTPESYAIKKRVEVQRIAKRAR